MGLKDKIIKGILKSAEATATVAKWTNPSKQEREALQKTIETLKHQQQVLDQKEDQKSDKK